MNVRIKCIQNLFKCDRFCQKNFMDLKNPNTTIKMNLVDKKETFN